MLNPFANPAFSMAALTAAINLIPNRYGRLQELDLFPEKPVRSRQILVEEKAGVLTLLLSAVRLSEQLGLQLQIHEVPAKLQELARVYGVDAALWPELAPQL